MACIKESAMLRQKVMKLNQDTWCINEFNLVNAFLRRTSDGALIIDTGYGLGNIRDTAENAIGLKIGKVLLTHSHPDHSGGIYHFHDCSILMNEKDEHAGIFDMKRDNGFRRMYVETRGPVRFPHHEKELISLIPATEPNCSFEFTAIEDGDMIDTGNGLIECLHTPGHTPGSMSYLDKKNRMLFSGDAVNKSIILPRLENNGNCLIEELDRTLRKIWKRESEFDCLAIGHDGNLIDKSIVPDYLSITDGILTGNPKGRYEEAGFRK